MKLILPAIVTGKSSATTTVEVHASSLSTALAELEPAYPGITGRVLRDSTTVHRFVNVFVNGEDLRYEGGPEVMLREKDEILILPAIAGGDDGRARPA